MSDAPVEPPNARTAGLHAILNRMALPENARILDVMPRAGGTETTAVLLAGSQAGIHVIPATSAERSPIEAAFGGRVSFSPAGLYDLVVVSPTLGEMVDMVRELPWLATRTLKPGGHMLTLTLRPDAIGRSGFDQAPPEVTQAFRDSFDVFAGRMVGLPTELAREFVLEDVVPRNPRSRSYVSWLVLRRRSLSDPMRRIRRPRGKTASRFDRFANDFVASAPLFAADDAREVLQDLVDPGFAHLAAPLSRRGPFRTVMVSHNDFVSDPRVLRTAGAVPAPVLAVGIGESPSGAVSVTPAGAPLLLLPDLRARIGRRLRLMGADTSKAGWTELKMAAGAASLSWILANVRSGGAVLHTHDFLALYLGGAALEALPANRRKEMRWIHDVHEYVRGYELIDANIQATASCWENLWLPQTDALTTVSPELAQQLAEHYPDAPDARVILSSNPADAPLDTNVADLRKMYGIGEAPMIIHVGSLRQGRGVEHVIDGLPRLVDHHLVLVGGGAESYLTALQAQAERLGVLERVHFHGFEPSGRLPALTVQADVGVVPMDAYGNAEVSLPNKLFIYIRAGVPVVATATKAMARFMTTWPIGRLVPCADVQALTRAIAQTVDNRDELSAAIQANETLRLAVSWEAQARILADIHAEVAGRMDRITQERRFQ